jgi:hypothetical protein
MFQAMTDNITIYRFPDGHASCAEDDVWISALFTSPEAALSWRDDWDGAERRFRELNHPTGKGHHSVGLCVGEKEGSQNSSTD